VAKRRTRLQKVIHALGLKPAHILREADRLAKLADRPSVSRQHFGRICAGLVSASEAKIYIIVAAIRSLTGLLFRPSELFDIDPALGAEPMEHGDAKVPSVFSDDRTSRLWREDVSQEPGSADDVVASLYRDYGLLLRTIAVRRYHIPPDDAEALAHDVFASYLQRRGYVNEVKGWLVGAIANASKNYLRKRKPEAELLPEHEEAVDVEAERQNDDLILRLTVGTVLSRLGGRCRDTLGLYYLHGKTKENIAEHLATSPGNVLQILVTCRKRAQDLIRRLSGRMR
jgi:RNA polymerase sigma factor (sigma-70 family)